MLALLVLSTGVNSLEAINECNTNVKIQTHNQKQLGVVYKGLMNWYVHQREYQRKYDNFWNVLTSYQHTWQCDIQMSHCQVC